MDNNIPHNKVISSEYIESLIDKLNAVPVYEDNYTLCQNAAYTIKMLMSPYVAVTTEEE